VIVTGESLGGLDIVYRLEKSDINVTLLAKDNEVGGAMKSVSEQVFCMRSV
jgi:protoporphyrinogen oxidase